MLYFTLVEPAVPENVGAAARALKTMGFADLWVVNSAVHQHKQANIVAHASGDILARARRFDSLAAVRSEVDLMVGTSAKPRHQRHVMLEPAELRSNLSDKLANQMDIALVFGREESGLHGDEVALCDLLTSIPLASLYPSLNLGQAVMLYAYELSSLRALHKDSSAESDPAQYRALQQKLTAMLAEFGYAPASKMAIWINEYLPLIDTRGLGFVHQLVDKTRQLMDQAR